MIAGKDGLQVDENFPVTWLEEGPEPSRRVFENSSAKELGPTETRN
jgi:hypothetical protein